MLAQRRRMSMFMGISIKRFMMTKIHQKMTFFQKGCILLKLHVKLGISPTANSSPSSDESISAWGDTDMSYLDERILPTPNLMMFSFSELRNATKNFGVDALLGEVDKHIIL
ncbi:hypothetical protein RHSIM_RhsimUnG0079100 [Rhododendron simsii]|uniref:Uncharacterized protein n=1 Tax=Rhododendron simsii TaxID=118357 RepID=A0A834L2R0_RHOSS|nr:hypothetical protein RHSIM_RhsimUnG0079100 [Rhododendron simsii]